MKDLSSTSSAVKKIIIFFAIIGLTVMAPPAINKIRLFTGLFFNKNDPRASLDLYSPYEWADKHFSEFSSLKTDYYDFIVWRREDFNGETINISNGIRYTDNRGVDPLDSSISVSFYGGSTTWGTGSSDAYTFPSIFSQSFGVMSKNFGESGYISRQSLEMLQNRYSTGLGGGEVVVFYDGVNDVLQHCRSDNYGIASGREKQIQSLVISGTQDAYSFHRVFQQVTSMFFSLVEKIISMSISYDEFYDCDSSQDKATRVANVLLGNWKQARALAESHGDRFYAILQPVAFIGRPDINYIELSDELNQEYRKQFLAVYPMIAEQAKLRNIEYSDFTETFDYCNDCYIDFCHVGPMGNKITALRIGEFLRSAGAIDL